VAGELACQCLGGAATQDGGGDVGVEDDETHAISARREA
jgi:hypothetical protein